MQPVYSSLEYESTTEISTTWESTTEKSEEALFAEAGKFDGYIIVVIFVLAMVVVATTSLKFSKKSKKSDEEDHLHTVTVWSFIHLKFKLYKKIMKI